MLRSVPYVLTLFFILGGLLYFNSSDQKMMKMRLADKDHLPKKPIQLDFLEQDLIRYYLAGLSVHQFYKSNIWFKDIATGESKVESVEGGDLNYDINLVPGSINGTILYSDYNRSHFFNSYPKIVSLAQSKREDFSKYQREAFDFNLLLIGYFHTALSFRKATLGAGEDYSKMLEFLSDNDSYLFSVGDRYDDPELVLFLRRHLIFGQKKYPCDYARQIINDLSIMAMAYQGNKEQKKAKSLKDFSFKTASYYLLKCKQPAKGIFPISFGEDDSKLWLAGYSYENSKGRKDFRPNIRKIYLEELSRKGYLDKYKEVLRELLVDNMIINGNVFNLLPLLVAYIRTFPLSILLMIFSLSLLVLNSFFKVKKQFLSCSGKRGGELCNIIKLNISVVFKNTKETILDYVKGKETNVWVIVSLTIFVASISFYFSEIDRDLGILMNSLN